MTALEAGKSLDYRTHRSGHSVYLFVLEGSLKANGEELQRRDGLGISNMEEIRLLAEENAEVLLIEAPMEADGI